MNNKIKTFNQHRLENMDAYYDRERSFIKAFENLVFSRNNHDEPDQGIFMSIIGIKDPLNDREVKILATFAQWLGSPVGEGLIDIAQNKSFGHPKLDFILDKLVAVRDDTDFKIEPLAFELAEQFLYDLSSKDIFPDQVLGSVENAVCFTFRKGDLVLWLEIYSDGEFGYIIENGKEKKTVKNSEALTAKEALKDIIEFCESD